MTDSDGLAVQATALLIDRLWGEPAARCHPVVWMGADLGWAGQRLAPPMDDVQALLLKGCAVHTGSGFSIPIGEPP